MTTAVFLDRDGTLNVEAGYLRVVEDLALMPGVAAAVKRLNDAGILAILTTNQSGPARGFYGEDHVKALNQRVQDLLQAEAGAHLDAMFYCPFLPPHPNKTLVAEYTQDSYDRKPNPGMIQKACEQFPEIDLKKSFVIGDKASDVELAAKATEIGGPCKGILVRTGYGERVLEGKYQTLTIQPDHIAADLTDAVAWILAKFF